MSRSGLDRIAQQQRTTDRQCCANCFRYLNTPISRFHGTQPNGQPAIARFCSEACAAAAGAQPIPDDAALYGGPPGGSMAP